MTFIQEIIAHLDKNFELNTKNLTFLFPSKRPAVYLKQELIKNATQPIISPKCLAITDFITEHSQLATVDSMTLVFELYQCYLEQLEKNQKALSLLEFYPLGETLVADYGDIDKDLVDAKSLFSNFKQIKEIENAFAFEDEQLEDFRNFWKHFSSKEPQKMQVEFLELWNMMGALYYSFRTRLQSQGMAYAGLAERNMAEDFSSITEKFKQKQIIICGFNALTKAEIQLFKELETVADVHYYFDYDEHYMAPHHEAGHFMRKNLNELQAASFKSQASLTLGAKSMNLTSASGTTGMVQALYHDINALDPSNYNSKTGIILPDENALRACIEVLPSLPANLNVTMGMPLQSTSLWSLVKALFSLHSNFNAPSQSFLYRDVIQVLQHPEMQAFESVKSQALIKHIAKQNMVYCSLNWLHKQDIASAFKEIFSTVGDNILVYIQSVLAVLETEADVDNNLRNSVLINLYQQCTRFSDLYASYLKGAGVSEIWTLFKKATKAKNISFEGEAAEGLQLMGLLESRAVDFEKLYVLSVNEGIIPKSSKHQSLIPYGIRKAFGMNTFREDDAMSAYYFYRMLQRATDINLYYNTDTDSDSKGEQSRFVLQIEQELPNFKMTKKTFSLKNDVERPLAFKIDKNSPVINSLAQYEVIDQEARRPLSPSALTTFIKSPVQFYIRYVANFKERDEVLEEMDPITLGNIVHNTLEELYEPYLNQEITFNLVETLKREKLQEILEKYLVQEMNIKIDQLQGRNLLFYNICHKLCSNVMFADAKTDGLKIHKLEFDQLHYDIEIETNEGPKRIRLKGQFDRLDEVNEQIRVVDYKTGNVKIPAKWPDVISKGFNDGAYAATLQTLFYTLVYLKNNSTHAVTPVIYHLKSSENMVKPVSESPITLDKLVDFERLLREKLEEIWDSTEPFAFTDYEQESKYLMMDIL